MEANWGRCSVLPAGLIVCQNSVLIARFFLVSEPDEIGLKKKLVFLWDSLHDTTHSEDSKVPLVDSIAAILLFTLL